MDFTYGATVEQQEDGYFVEFPAFGGGVFADGDTLAEACASASTTLRLAIAEYLESGIRLPDPGSLEEGRMVFTVEVSDPFIIESKCMTPGEAAEYLGVSAGRISQMLNEGQLETLSHAGRKLITLASLNARRAASPKAGRPRKAGRPVA